MQANKECMKDILKFVINNTSVEVEDDSETISILCIDIQSIIDDLSQNNTYSKEDIVYNILKCYKYHLIDGDIPRSYSIKMDDCDICDITLEGERFLNGSLELF